MPAPDLPTSFPDSTQRRLADGWPFLVALVALGAAVGWWQLGSSGELADQTNRSSGAADSAHAMEVSALKPKIQKSDDEWRSQLTDEQYHVTREKGTERPYSGAYWNFKEQGTYKCVGCGAELFTSDTKYDSGCGWPSFFAPGTPENFHEETDRSHGMLRTEVTCSQCGAHLGHLFDDGPLPTGQDSQKPAEKLLLAHSGGGESH